MLLYRVHVFTGLDALEVYWFDSLATVRASINLTYSAIDQPREVVEGDKIHFYVHGNLKPSITVSRQEMPIIESCAIHF